MIRRSKLSLSDSVQAKVHTTIENQGAPLRSFQANGLGRYPSSAMASGRREYDMVSELRIPAVLTSAPITTARPSQGLATVPAMVAQLPVDQASAGTCTLQTATTGMT